MKCFSKTDIGLVRSENQDRVWTSQLDDGAVAVILCDGMGGENAGSVASQMTVDFMSDRIQKRLSLQHKPQLHKKSADYLRYCG